MVESLIKVNRILESQKSTIGELLFNDVFICNTLEDVVRPKGIKIYGETAIPEGRYEVKMHFWQKYNDYYPQLLDVPGFEGILFHAGVNKDHTEGCLLTGLYDPLTPDQLFSSRFVYRNILLRNVKAALKVGTLFCEVKNCFESV